MARSLGGAGEASVARIFPPCHSPCMPRPSLPDPRSRASLTAALVSLPLFLAAASVAAQLPPAAPAFQGLAGSGVALVRGGGALAVNPASLGLPSSPAWSLVFPSASVRVGLAPVTGGDLRRSGGRSLPDARREEWLARIREDGEQRGGGRAEVTQMAFTTGPVGIQVGTMALGRVVLNGDAAELLLYGNAGRTGEPGDFDLAGSSLDGAVYSTGAVSVAFPLAPRRGRREAAALGVTLKYTEGNRLIMGRDAGSILRGDPVGVELRFPIAQTDPDRGWVRNGGGLGVDVALAWEEGPWAASVLMENLVHGFRWEAEGLVYRPGEALFNAASNDADLAPRPFSGAPPGFRDLVEGLRFRRALVGSVAWSGEPQVTWSAAFRLARGGGIETGPVRMASLGVEHRGSPRFPLRAGGALFSGGWSAAGGLGLVAGLVELQLSGAAHRDRDGPATLVSVGLVITGR